MSGIQFNIVGAKLGNTEMPWVAEKPWTLAGIAGEAQWDIDGMKDVKCPRIPHFTGGYIFVSLLVAREKKNSNWLKPKLDVIDSHI